MQGALTSPFPMLPTDSRMARDGRIRVELVSEYIYNAGQLVRGGHEQLKWEVSGRPISLVGNFAFQPPSIIKRKSHEAYCNPTPNTGNYIVRRFS